MMIPVKWLCGSSAILSPGDAVHERVTYVRPADPRLGRHVNHDPRSRRFPVRTAPVPLRTVEHERHVGVFQQGDLGSCTGNAALGCMATGPFWDALTDWQR